MTTDLHQRYTGTTPEADDVVWSACPVCGSPTPMHCMHEDVRNPIERTAVWFLGGIALSLSCVLLAELWLGQQIFDIPLVRQFLFEH